MGDFPAVLKNPANRIAAASQFTDDVEGYVFDGAEGSQVAFWRCDRDRVSQEHAHAFDEWVLVIEGRCTATMEGRTVELAAGDELLIPKGTVQTMAVVAGTRTVHVFGGPRARRAAESSPRFAFADLIGTWVLDVTPSLRAFIDATIRAVAPPSAIDAALAEAFHEAEGAEIQIHADRLFVSRSHGVDLLHATIPAVAEPFEELVFDKAPGQEVRIRRAGDHELRVEQPGKPVMTFRRRGSA